MPVNGELGILGKSTPFQNLLFSAIFSASEECTHTSSVMCTVQHLKRGGGWGGGGGESSVLMGVQQQATTLSRKSTRLLVAVVYLAL